MENASKALIMAGGILIGMLILALFAFEMSNMSITAKAYEEEMARTQVLEFNSRFESYAYDSEGNDEKLKAQQVVTLYNYVQEWNTGGEVNEGHPSDIIDMKFGTAWDLKNTFNNIQNKTETIEEFLLKYPESEYYFTCTNLGYREPDGRIYTLTIKCVKK